MDTLLLEHFDELISTPEDVEKLNRSILQLAMQGKLVEQNPNDEPASELLKRIHKSDLATKKVSPIHQDEIPFSAPSGWAWAHIPEVTYNWGQKKPDKQFTYIDVSSIDNQHGKVGDNLAIVEAKDAPSRARKIVKRGCVIYSTVRPYLLNIAVIDRDIQPEPIVSTAFYVMQPMEGLDVGFLFLYLRSEYFTKFVESQMTGMAYPAISDGKMSQGVIPLPPFAEQQRIFAQVEELFAQTRLLTERLAHARAELGRLNESSLAHLLASQTPEEFNERWDFIAEHFDLLTSVPEHIAPLRQSILELAVRGKLTRREPRDEPARDLLKRIKEEKAILVEEGNLKNEKPLPPIKESEKPFELPNTWEWAKLEHIAANRPNALKAGPFGSSLKKSVYVEGGYKVYGQEQVIKDDADFGDYYIDEKLFERLHSNSVNPGDILISLVGTIGKVLVLPEGSKPGIINPRLVKLSLFDEVNRSYIKYCLYSPTAKNIMSESSHGGTMNILNLKLLKELPIPLPPLAEQERIVKRVEQLLAWCDALEAWLRSAEEERGRLVESVLAKVATTLEG